MAERRLTQKDIKQPDQFITFSVQAFDWAKIHAMHLLYGLLGVLVVIGLLIAWNLWQTQRQQTAERLLYAAVNTLKNDEKSSETTTPLAVQEQLQRIIRDYKATPAAALAAWHLGHAYFKQGDFAAALASYEQARDWSRHGTDMLMPLLVTLNMGYAEEAKGNYSNAIARFEEVTRSTATWLHGEAFLGMARCYEKTGAPAKALETYERALNAMAVSGAIRQQIEERQAWLRSSMQAAAPQNPPGKP